MVSTPTPVVETYTASHYGTYFNGSTLGCGGIYDSTDSTILAVGPSDYARWPCGTKLEVSSPSGSVIAIRKDSCPGCRGRIDMSEAGHYAVCGYAGVCQVVVTKVEED